MNSELIVDTLNKVPSIRPFLLVFLAAVILFSSCASNKHRPHKKLKPGKPIPCPQKDC